MKDESWKLNVFRLSFKIRRFRKLSRVLSPVSGFLSRIVAPLPVKRSACNLQLSTFTLQRLKRKISFPAAHNPARGSSPAWSTSGRRRSPAGRPVQVAEVRPGHWWHERSGVVHAFVFAFGHRLLELLVAPVADTGFVGGQVRGVGLTPGPCVVVSCMDISTQPLANTFVSEGPSGISAGWPDRRREVSGSGPIGPITLGLWQSSQPMMPTR